MVSSIETFIHQVLGIDKLPINTQIDVSDKNIAIKSYNKDAGVIEYKKLKRVIRKLDSVTYTVKTEKQSVNVTKDHKFYIKLQKLPFYAPLEQIIKMKGSINLLSDENSWEPIISITKNKKRTEIYDLEIEGNNNLFTNGVLSHNSMGGDGTTTTGGHAIKFYSDVRWKMWKTNDKEHESNMTTIDVIKSKVGKPFGQAKVAILWGRGFDKMGEVVDYAIDFGIMKRSGAWYSYQDSNVGQGMEKTRLMLEDNPELYEEIKNKVLEKLNDNS